MYYGGERRWRREIFKGKCMVGRWKKKKRRGRRSSSSHETRYSDGRVGIQCEGVGGVGGGCGGGGCRGGGGGGGGSNRKMFKEEEQNWIKKKCIVEE